MGGGEDAGGGVWEDDGGAGFNGGVQQCQTDRSAAAPGQLQQRRSGHVYTAMATVLTGWCAGSHG
jgi:hypothetical protein